VGVWDIAALPPGEQFGYWHEVICQAFVPLTPHRTRGPDDDGEGFPARVETRELAGLTRASLRSQPQRTDHGPRDVARTDDAVYFVNLQLAGRCVTTVGGETSVVEAGQFVVVDTTRPYWFLLDRPWQLLSYRLPHAALADVVGDRELVLGRALGGPGAGAVVRTLMEALWPLADDTPGAPELVGSFAAAVAAAATRERSPDTDGRAVTAGAVRAYVERHLGDRDLSVAGVCRRFAISPRTLHGLFADGDESFARAVRRLRLERCAAILADPRTTDTVTAVAAAHGFDDPTSFSRAFRRHFGVAPRDVRGSG
jgi:AraC family transcriptional regulator, positive regulator of tynA and feaB